MFVPENLEYFARKMVGTPNLGGAAAGRYAYDDLPLLFQQHFSLVSHLTNIPIFFNNFGRLPLSICELRLFNIIVMIPWIHLQLCYISRLSTF